MCCLNMNYEEQKQPSSPYYENIKKKTMNINELNKPSKLKQPDKCNTNEDGKRKKVVLKEETYL